MGEQGMSTIIMLVLMFAVMYFLMIRPEKKRKQKAEEILRLHDNDYGITKSIGMSLFPDMGRNYDVLFRKADKALYQAKQKRNAYCVYGEEE